MPRSTRILSEFGENIKFARMRRKITATMLAERAGITRVTLKKVEQGNAGVSVGIYAMILMCLGLDNDLLLVAKDDVLGRKLQDIDMIKQFSEETSDKEIPKSVGKTNSATAFRRASILGKIPEWLSVGEMKKIEELYEKAAELTNKTGVSHHVDHIIPLAGRNQTGLHVLANLQILTAKENLKKSNL